MKLKGKKVGFVLTGSFCTFKNTILQIENIMKEDAEVIPIMSNHAYEMDTKFGTASDFINQIETTYTDVGYKVIKTIAKQNEGIKELKDLLKNNITAFSGNSGVGKSTLINSIFSNEMTKEGMISSKNKRGKNTTTNTYLYKLDNNSYIADTPGFSTFDISEIKSEDLYKYFPELNKYSKDCEFIGCTHIKEENCGIKEAVENGNIAQARYERFCKIYLDLKQKEARKW